MANKKNSAYKDNYEYLWELQRYYRALTDVRILEKDLQTGEFPEGDVKLHRTNLTSTRRECTGSRNRIEHRIILTLDAGEVELPLETIQRQFNLNAFEKNVLGIVTCSQLYPDLSEHLSKLSGNTDIDVKTVLTLFCDTLRERITARNCLMSEGNLLKNGLLQSDYLRSVQIESIFQRSDLQTSIRIYNRILGENTDNGELAAISSMLEPADKLDDVILPQSIKDDALQFINKHGKCIENRDEQCPDANGTWRGSAVLLLSGPDGSGRKTLAEALAAENGSRCFLVNTKAMIDSRESTVNELSREIFTEARIQDAIVLLEGSDRLFSSENGSELEMLRNRIQHFGGITILTSIRKYRLKEIFRNSMTLELELPVPDSCAREIIWRKLMPMNVSVADDVDLGKIAKDFELTGGSIKETLFHASLEGMSSPSYEYELTQKNLISCATDQRRVMNNSLQHEAEFSPFFSWGRNDTGISQESLSAISPSVCLEDVILPAEIMNQIKSIINAADKQDTVFNAWGFGEKIKSGQSVSAIFHGESGTGKTLTAEVIAGELNMKLCTVQTSSLISKWVGESEKNIASIFRDIDDRSVLFFDEADSIFISRMEEGSSTAEYINRRISCLLKEIESFKGIVILATNFPGLIDTAFERRIRFKVNFPRPDAAAREAIWLRNIPDNAPLAENVNFTELAQEYDFTGGQIRSVLLRAAFAAAGGGNSLNRELLVNAADEERPFNKESSFGFMGNM